MDGIPTTISRTQLCDSIRALGLQPEDTIYVQWEPGHVTAEVLLRDEEGNRFELGGKLHRKVFHIRVADDETSS